MIFYLLRQSLFQTNDFRALLDWRLMENVLNFNMHHNSVPVKIQSKNFKVKILISGSTRVICPRNGCQLDSHWS